MKYLKYIPYSYFFVISLISMILTLTDKKRARGYISQKNNPRRIPERTLFFTASLGGAAAMYITMKLIRHKTKHKRFMLGLPAIITAQLVITVFVIILYEL